MCLVICCPSVFQEREPRKPTTAGGHPRLLPATKMDGNIANEKHCEGLEIFSLSTRAGQQRKRTCWAGVRARACGCLKCRLSEQVPARLGGDALGTSLSISSSPSCSGSYLPLFCDCVVVDAARLLLSGSSKISEATNCLIVRNKRTR